MNRKETLKHKLQLLSNLIYEVEGVRVEPEELAKQYTVKNLEKEIDFYLYLLDK
jgi:hypothetical protein